MTSGGKQIKPSPRRALTVPQFEDRFRPGDVINTIHCKNTDYNVTVVDVKPGSLKFTGRNNAGASLQFWKNDSWIKQKTENQ